MAKALKEEQNLGYKVVGFLDDDPEKTGTFIDGVKVHNGIDKAARYIGKSGINTVVVAIPGASRERLNEVINNLQYKTENILFVPDLIGIAVLGTRLQHFFREHVRRQPFERRHQPGEEASYRHSSIPLVSTVCVGPISRAPASPRPPRDDPWRC